MKTSRDIEVCPRCKLTDRVSPKLLLIDPADPADAAASPHWRVTCSCEGDLTVDSLKPEFLRGGALGQFIEALYCDRCGIGFVSEYMAKPPPPRYKAAPAGFRRVYPDGTVGPLLKRIADDPERSAT